EELPRDTAGAERGVAVAQAAVRPEEIERQVLQALVGLAPLPLFEGAPGTGMAGAQQRGEAAVAGEPEELDLDVRLGEPLADDGIAQRALARGVLAEGPAEVRQG